MVLQSENMIVRALNANELVEAERIGIIAFERLPGALALTEGEAAFYGAFSGTKMIAKAKCLDLRIRFDGSILPASGIADVATLPEYRRQGAVRTLMRTMLEAQYEAELPFSCLQAFNHAFYRPFGFGDIEPLLEWTIPLQALPDAHLPNTAPAAFTPYGGDLTPFKAAYEKQPHYNLSLERTDAQYPAVTSADATAERTGKFKFAFAYLDLGYITFEKTMEDGRAILNASPWTNELVFDTPETLKALLSFAKTYASCYDSVRFVTPTCLPLEKFIYDGFGAIQVVRKLLVGGMARVVHPVAALHAAHYIGSGSFTLKIRDDFLKREHFLKVEYEDGMARSIKEASGEPDAIYDIGLFSQALLGRWSSEELRCLGAVPLPQLFYKKPIFNTNYY